MTTLREAAQQALEALESACHGYVTGGLPEVQQAIYALKAALVEDAMQKFTDVNQELEAALAEPVHDTGVKLKPVFYAPRILDDEEVAAIIAAPPK